jgi:hypothetical protein
MSNDTVFSRSTSISNIEANFGKPIMITFKGTERTYAYEPNDEFIEDFAKVVLTKGSLGRLVNNYLKSGILKPLS